ncbi:MAG: hypothetical protein E3J56_11815 [Candidatus Aminicenantes bacterium]|nr:MAG: hypothetical protein E3J56_11815 [Candidatus Aminicenantes bacterium]
MAKKHYNNETNILQVVYDYRMVPHRVLPGESVELEIEPEIKEAGLKSDPPDGMQGITNVYRNPETERLEVEFADGEEELPNE